MPLVPMRILLDHAAENGYGIAAFNVNNMEQIQAIMQAAVETESPVIVQASRGARSYTNDNYLRHLMLAAAELHPELPIVMHQDHGNSPDTCFSAIDNGFTSVMMDGSLHEDGKTPATFDYNCETTKKVVDKAHSLGVTVEGELGCLGSLETGKGEKEDGHGFEGALSRDQLLTNPDEAVEFVERTGADALAVAIGTSHGAYKSGRKDPETGETIHPPMELVRLAIPRRVYTISHLKYIAHVFGKIMQYKDRLSGFEITYEPKFLRHFTMHLKEIKPQKIGV